MLFAMFGRHKAAGDWLYPLLGTLALFLVSAIAVYVLPGVWRDRAAAAEAEAQEPAAAPDSRSAAEILDRRLALGEITVEQYDELTQALARGRARAAEPAAAPIAAAVNGAVHAAA
jgi:uncharacterized membrane protein